MSDSTPSPRRVAYLREKRRERNAVRAVQLALLAVLLAMWELSARLGWIDAFVVSSPARVIATLAGLTRSGELWVHLGVSCLETAAGFLLGTLCGTLIAVVLCVLSSMGSTTGFLHNAAGVVTQPFRSAAASVGGWFGSISEHFQSVDTLKQENAELRKKNAELEEQVRQAQTDSEENARLRTLLNLRQQRQDFSFESAHIIERSTSNWSSAMTLSKGTSSDIAIGDCVVNEEGYLVGVITDAGLTWSTVTTILDTDSQLGAKVFRTGEVTVAMGDLSLMQQGRLKLSYLSDESGLVNGDLLLTSGLGGYYPSGLGIGSVEEVRTDDNGLTKYAVIAPLVDMNQLTEVFVITDFDIVD